MTARAEVRDGFAGLTIRDERGASLVIERTADNGKTVVWIAPPGENDGPGVGISSDDRQQLVGFLAADDAPRSWDIAPEPNVPAVRDRHGRLWVRTDYEKAPTAWWLGERGASIPHSWYELLGGYGPLTEADATESANV